MQAHPKKLSGTDADDDFSEFGSLPLARTTPSKTEELSSTYPTATTGRLGSSRVVLDNDTFSRSTSVLSKMPIGAKFFTTSMALGGILQLFISYDVGQFIGACIAIILAAGLVLRFNSIRRVVIVWALLAVVGNIVLFVHLRTEQHKVDQAYSYFTQNTYSQNLTVYEQQQLAQLPQPTVTFGQYANASESIRRAERSALIGAGIYVLMAIYFYRPSVRSYFEL